jgi:hypothetical protein
MTGIEALAFCGIAEGTHEEQALGCRKLKGVVHLLNIEVADPAGAEAEIGCLEHHLGAGNGSILLACACIRRERVLPLELGIERHQKHDRCIEGARRNERTFASASSLVSA